MSGPEGGSFKDCETLARQSWDAWSEYLRSAGGAGSGEATVERILGSLKGFFAWMEAVAAAGAAADAGSSHDWLAKALGSEGAGPLLRAFADLDSVGARGFETMQQQWQAMVTPWQKEWSSWLGMPALGYTREHQERQQKLAQAWLDCQMQLGRYHALIARANRLGAERLETKLAERAEPGRQIESLRALYDLWVDAAEEAYAEVALSPEFGEVYGALVDAQMRVRALLQRQTEEIARQLGMPTRSEVAAIGQRLQEVRRELRKNAGHALADEVAALRAEIAELRAQIGKTPGTRKAPPAKAPSARKPKPRKS